MLGLKKRKPAAAFFALGKHPAFNDYFSLNEPSTLSEAMTLWIEKGVQEKKKVKKRLTKADVQLMVPFIPTDSGCRPDAGRNWP